MGKKAFFSVFLLSCITAAAFGTYATPLPENMAEDRTFFDGQLATGWWAPATTGTWTKGTIGGNVSGIEISPFAWENSGDKNGAYVEWNTVHISSADSYEIWLSSYVTANVATTGSYLCAWKVQAGADAASLRTVLSNTQVEYASYDQTAGWTMLGSVDLLPTDALIRITYVSNSSYQTYRLGVDEVVLATSVPEPTTIGLLAMGAVFVIRRRK